MFGVRCPVLVVCCLLFAANCLGFCLFSVACVVVFLLVVAWRVLFVVHDALFVVGCSSFGVLLCAVVC